MRKAVIVVVAVVLAAVAGALVTSYLLNWWKASTVPEQDRTDIGGVDAGEVVFWATAELQSIGLALHSIVQPQSVTLTIGEVSIYVDSPLVETGLFFSTILLSVAVAKRIMAKR